MKIAFCFFVLLLFGTPPRSWQSVTTGFGNPSWVLPRPGSLAAALIAMSVTMRKYHDRLHGSSRYPSATKDSGNGYCRSHRMVVIAYPLPPERRYRRNRSVRFYRHLVRTGSAFPRLPRRFAPRNDKSGAILILTVTCTNRQQCAGRGTPRLRDFHNNYFSPSSVSLRISVP